MQWRGLVLVLAWVGMACAGCASADPRPLTAEAVADSLAVPSDEALRVRASDIRHPQLQPVALNLRDGLSPDEAAVLAVLQNPELRVIRDQRGIAAAQLIQAGLLPNVALDGNLEFPIAAKGEGTGYGLGLSWEITSLIGRSDRQEQARANMTAVDLDLAWQEWQVAQAAKIALWRLVGLEQQKQVAAEVEGRLRQNLDRIRRAFEEQQQTTIQLAAAEAASREATSSLLEIESALHQQAFALKQLLGLPPDVPLRPEPGLEALSALRPPSAADLLRDLESRRLDLLALRQGYESQEAAVRVAVLAQFPRITLGVSHTRDTGAFFTIAPGVGIELPFFDRSQGAIALQKATRQRLFDEYVQRVFDARAAVAALLAQIESLNAQIANARGAVPVLRRLVETYRLAVAAGQADVLSYYAAQNDLANKTLEVHRLRQELVEAGIALENACGRTLSEAGTREMDGAQPGSGKGAAP